MNAQSTTQEEFFSECYLHYQGIIKKYIASRIYYSLEVDDLVQDVFVRLWEHMDFVNRETVRPLLFTIARNMIVDKIRRYYKREDFITYIYNVQEEGRNTTEETVSSRELEILHKQVVNTLPIKRRKIYELSFQGMASPMIADKLSLSIRTIEGQLLMARKLVRTYIKQQFAEVG